MSIGVSLLVVALGAIFTFAVPNSPDMLDLHVVGVILMIVGGVGLFLRLFGYGPDNIVTLPRWGRPTADPLAGAPVDSPPVDEIGASRRWRYGFRDSRWRRGRTRIVEERVYDPMAEDPTVYRPAEDVPPEQAPTAHPMVREERRYEE